MTNSTTVQLEGEDESPLVKPPYYIMLTGFRIGADKQDPDYPVSIYQFHDTTAKFHVGRPAKIEGIHSWMYKYRVVYHGDERGYDGTWTMMDVMTPQRLPLPQRQDIVENYIRLLALKFNIEVKEIVWA